MSYLLREHGRRHAREYQRTRWGRKIAERNRTAETCQRRHGRHGVCGDRLYWTTSLEGRAIQVCERCERFKAGVCRDCPRPVEGMKRRAVRCKICKRRALQRAKGAYCQRNGEDYRRYQREWGRAHRAQRSATRRAWVAKNLERVRLIDLRAHAKRRALRSHPCLVCGAALHGALKKCRGCGGRLSTDRVVRKLERAA